MKGIKLKNLDSLLMQKKELCAAAWKDKKVVFYLSTNCNPSETINVQRKQKDGTIKDDPSPIIGQMYNKYMFGVDRADQLRINYSTCRKALKEVKLLHVNRSLHGLGNRMENTKLNVLRKFLYELKTDFSVQEIYVVKGLNQALLTSRRARQIA